MKRNPLIKLVFLMLVYLLTGCLRSTTTETAATEELPVVAPSEDRVRAEGSVEPGRWVELRSHGGGYVTEVRVSAGDEVASGDALVILDSTDSKLILEDAQAVLALAEARLAEVKGQPLPEEVAVKEAQLAAALASVAQETAQRDRVVGGEASVEVAAARASLAAARADLKQAYNLHEKTMECFSYRLPDGTEGEVCPALGPLEEQARREWHVAQERFGAAELQLRAAENEAKAKIREVGAGLAMASAQANVVEARLQLEKAGSSAEEIAKAQAAVAEAKASVAAAEAALEEMVIRAPFAGTIAGMAVTIGDTVAPSQALLVLATLDDLRVRTQDLTALDVVGIGIGQSVVVTIDAFPNESLEGHVARIGEESEDYRGDVTYPVIVALDDENPGVRWGMTAVVDFGVE